MKLCELKKAVIPLFALGLLILASCNNEEESITSPPPGPETMSISFADPLSIVVDTARHWALLVHDRSSSRGTAIQLVDIAHHTVLNTRILDFFDVFDVAFLPGDEACFAARTQSRMDYAVQFFSLPDLELGTLVITADTSGTHGYLAVDMQGRFVYYSHAGGDGKDGLYKISIATKTLVNADADGGARTAFDNDLVSGLYESPAKAFYDVPSQKIMIANLGADYVTQLNANLWGTLHRSDHLSYPVDGAIHLNTLAGSPGEVRAQAMAAAGNGVYVFAGTSDGTAYLSRTEINATLPYPPETMPSSRQWRFRNGNMLVHPREDIQSIFILQRDSTRTGIGRYNLNNLRAVAGSPYHTRAIPDSSISAIGLDTGLDLLISGDSRVPRLEFIPIQ